MDKFNYLRTIYYSDDTKSIDETQTWVTITHAICYILVTAYGFFNIYQVLYKSKRYKNFLLLIFYTFAVSTLLCKKFS